VTTSSDDADLVGRARRGCAASVAALAVGVPELPDLTALASGLVATTEDPPP
jgi:hypothetical protein